jgi:lipopolysaccharide assembly protein B
LDFDLQWLLLALPITFGLGWLASRWDWRQMQRDEKRSPRAYFKGLTHLLNEEPDQAIDAFIEVVQNDPDTADLHFALGSLFRKRGEFERAVRVHQHLLQRADLRSTDRERAQLALAQDYMKAGLFDRSQAAFEALLNTSHRQDALIALLQLHERARDWTAATATAQQLEADGAGDFSRRRAHHACERYAEQQAANDASAATSLQQAHAADPNGLRVAMLMASEPPDSQARWHAAQALLSRHPHALGLYAELVLKAAADAGQETAALAQIQALHDAHPSLDVLVALLQHQASDASARHAAYHSHLHKNPSLAAVAAVAASAPPNSQDPVSVQTLQRSVSRRYRCAACGFESQRHFWQCPGCLSWDSFPPARGED